MFLGNQPAVRWQLWWNVPQQDLKPLREKKKKSFTCSVVFGVVLFFDSVFFGDLYWFAATSSSEKKVHKLQNYYYALQCVGFICKKKKLCLFMLYCSESFQIHWRASTAVYSHFLLKRKILKVKHPPFIFLAKKLKHDIRFALLKPITLMSSGLYRVGKLHSTDTILSLYCTEFSLEA